MEPLFLRTDVQPHLQTFQRQAILYDCQGYIGKWEVILSEQTWTKIHHTYDQRFGGYSTYWKRYFELWGKIFEIPWETPWKMTRVHSIIATILKTPWWLLLKPLGCLFKQRTVMVGDHLKVSGKLTEWNIRKTVTWFLVGIPVLWYRSKMTEEELAVL